MVICMDSLGKTGVMELSKAFYCMDYELLITELNT